MYYKPETHIIRFRIIRDIIVLPHVLSSRIRKKTTVKIEKKNLQQPLFDLQTSSIYMYIPIYILYYCK